MRGARRLNRDVHRGSLRAKRCELSSRWPDTGARGANELWTALVEVKTGRNDLEAEQVTTYLDVAREHGYDAVITISHQVATTPGVHPVTVDGRKTRKVL